MVAYGSYGSQRASEAMREVYLRALAENTATAATAAVRTGSAIVDQLFPGRVFDHTAALPLAERFAESAGVWLGQFGDTVVWMVPSTAERGRMDRQVGTDRPVRALLIEGEGVTLSYVDRAAGIERMVEIGPEATRGDVRDAARGEPLPFEQPFLDGPPDEELPLFSYLEEARSWLFGLRRPPSPVPPAARMVRGYHLSPVDAAAPLADGRPVVELPAPDELAGLLASADLLDDQDGRYVAGGGDWFQLHRVDPDRALLVGCDVEDTETYFGAAVAYFDAEEETDLLAGAPEWWVDLVRTRHPGAVSTEAEFDPITIVCGWEGGEWTKAVGAPDPVLLYDFLEDDEDA